ncbi:hypothetical protein [Sorangium sp. So ce693]|uniref:hypothetical protein n=1 Tax=Sorangium sp. So ce693 TaxID=3133318 RepID=UPI003F5E7090
MSDNTYVNIYVSNNLGYGIGQVWLSHTTSETTWTECWIGENVANGQSTLTQGWSAALVPSSNDYFTVMWTDTSNNLYGTSIKFKAVCDTDGGDIDLQLQGTGSSVVVLQGTTIQGSTSIFQYGYAPSSSSAARAAERPTSGVARAPS